MINGGRPPSPPDKKWSLRRAAPVKDRTAGNKYTNYHFGNPPYKKFHSNRISILKIIPYLYDIGITKNR